MSYGILPGISQHAIHALAGYYTVYKYYKSAAGPNCIIYTNRTNGLHVVKITIEDFACMCSDTHPVSLFQMSHLQTYNQGGMP